MRLSFSVIFTVLVVCAVAAAIEFPNFANAESNLVSAADDDPIPELVADGRAVCDDSDSVVPNLRVRPRDDCDRYKPKVPTANGDLNKPSDAGEHGEGSDDRPEKAAEELPISLESYFDQFNLCVYWIVCGEWRATDLPVNMVSVFVKKGVDLVDADQCQCSLYYSCMKVALKHLIR